MINHNTCEISNFDKLNAIVAKPVKYVTKSLIPQFMKDHTFSVSRRKFLQRAATAAIAAPFILRCSSSSSSPKNILNHACIGVGGMGWSRPPEIQRASKCADCCNM